MNSVVRAIWRVMATAVVILLLVGGAGVGAGRVQAAPAPWEAMEIASICVRWVTGEAYTAILEVKLTAIEVPVYGELLFEIDQHQKGPWRTVAADVFIGEGQSLVVPYVPKIDWAVRFRLWAAVVDGDPTTLGPGQGLAATGWFEPAKLIPMC